MQCNDTERRALWSLEFPDLSWEDIQKILNTPLTINCFDYDHKYVDRNLEVKQYLDELNRVRAWSSFNNQVPEEDRISYFKLLLNLLPRSYNVVKLPNS